MTYIEECAGEFINDCPFEVCKCIGLDKINERKEEINNKKDDSSNNNLPPFINNLENKAL